MAGKPGSYQILHPRVIPLAHVPLPKLAVDVFAVRPALVFRYSSIPSSVAVAMIAVYSESE
jgi:hypothetical protein